MPQAVELPSVLPTPAPAAAPIMPAMVDPRGITSQAETGAHAPPPTSFVSFAPLITQ